jgi:hypothetical protein
MAEIKQLFQINCLPGVKRDGTALDGDQFNDAQWCRFQRGRPKKIGGCQVITDRLSGPARSTLVWSRGVMNAIHGFSQYGIEALLVDNNGLGNLVASRTPVGFTENANGIWSVDTQYDDAVGSSGTVILAHMSSSLANIDDTTATKPYLGLASDNSVFTQIADAPAVSGGVFSVAPYTFAYGSDGFLAWSDANQPQVWDTSSGAIGDAGSDRITGAKIVKGLPLRSGNGVAALLWSLDSVIRMDSSNNNAIFRFSHLSSQASILSQNSVIEYDGIYYWVGIDRFLMCDGSKVAELPNAINLNWFFDNLNFEHRQKVWAMKVPRFGEIWWFYPRGEATECSHAVIFNVRENLWYDIECPRSSGYYSQVFHYPVMADANASDTLKVLVLSGGAGTVSVGDVIYGVISGTTATVVNIVGTSYTVSVTSDISDFTVTEQVVDSTSGATRIVDSSTPQYSVYLHEKGYDLVNGDQVTAIESYFETADFGLPTGGSQPNQTEGLNRWTRLIRVEPDFVQEGEISMVVLGKEFANAEQVSSTSYNFTNTTDKVDVRNQYREIRLRFTSNTVGGHYEMGRVILHTEPGDKRS